MDEKGDYRFVREPVKRTRRDFLTPAIVIFGVVIVILALWVVICDAQTHTMPGSNVVPSGASLTINSGGSITAAAGSTVTGFGSPLQWDGGATNLVAATGRTSLGLVVGTNVAPATSGSSILYGNGSGGFSNVTVGSGLSFTTGTLTATGGSGITNIATTSPITGGPITTTGTIDFLHNVDLAMTVGQTMTVSNATTNAVDDLITITHNSTGSGAIGFGSGILFRAETDSTNSQNQAGIRTAWSVAANGTRTAYMDLLVEGNAGVNMAPVRIFGDSGSTSMSVGSTTDPGSGGIINANAGYMVGGAAATAGKILQSNGSRYQDSTPTWPTAAGTAGYTLRSDGTNFASYPQDMFNSSVTSQATFSTADLYITNSNVAVAAGDMKAKGQYRCLFDMTKSAGTGAIVISLRVGTLGTTGDPAILTFTFGAGTAIADTGVFEIIATWRTVGSGTSAVMQGVCRAQKNAATTTGLWNNAGTDLVIVAATSSGFNSSTATQVGISFNGSTTFAGTSTLCQATLIQ